LDLGKTELLTDALILPFIDGEMTAIALNAHKIGVILVQEKVRRRLEMAVHQAGSILHQSDMQKQALHTEYELENKNGPLTHIIHA